MSERERVRRLLESAIMNARAVISAMKTVNCVGKGCRRFGVRDEGGGWTRVGGREEGRSVGCWRGIIEWI